MNIMIYLLMIIFILFSVISMMKVCYNLIEISKYKGYNYFDRIDKDD